MKLFKLWSLLFVVLGVLFSIQLFNFDQALLGACALIITALSGYIFFHPKHQALRFMYPGLITFLLFMILPMVFTIFIGLTNLSTGHFLSKNEVLKTLLSETMVKEQARSLKYKLYPLENDKYAIVVNNSIASFSLSDKEALFTIGKAPNTTPLSLGEVFALREQLKNISFKLNRLSLSYYRSDQLIESMKRFKSSGDDTLIDQTNQKVYLSDDERGYFINKNDSKDLLSPGFYTFVGLKNYKRILTDKNLVSSFSKVLTWTLLWSLLSVFLTFSFGSFLAILINDKALSFKSFYRILFIIPYSIPFFISVLIFKGLLNQDFGAINHLLSYIGIGKIPWLEQALWAKVSCLIVNLWLGFPYMFLVVTGILQSIPESIYEAAKLDGASRFAAFRHITLPLVMSAMGPLLIGSFAFNLNNFVGIYLLTGGGPPMLGALTPVGETDILISYTYRLAFEGSGGQDLGLASCMSMFIFLIIAILTLINFKITGMGKEKENH